MHDITKLLDQIQTQNNLTHYGLAKAIGVSPQYLYRLIKKPFLVNETTAVKIAICAGIDGLELIASLNYRYGSETHQEFWKSVYLGRRTENWKVEYSTGGFCMRPYWNRKRGQSH